MKILLTGLAKSGTTALLYKINNSLKGDNKLLFEPQKYNGEEGENVIAKAFINVNLNSFKDFDKKILIIRDPRDRMISLFLYLFYEYGKPILKVHEQKLFEKEKNIIKKINLLQKKEDNPDSISFINLSRKFFGEHFLESQYVNIMELINQFYEDNPDFFIIKYEDFIDGKLSNLEGYLGFNLSGAAKVPENVSRVVRTKSYGSWKNWFTKEDVKILKKINKNLMKKFDYTDWKLNKKQKILSENCSEYVKRIVNQRRERENLKKIEF